MKNLYLTLGSCLLMTGVAPAVTTSLDLPADGNYTTPTVVTTNLSSGAATFDISYTITAISNDTGALVGVGGGAIGVGSDNDVNPQHYTTLEGNGAAGANGSTPGGEGLSFTNLSLSNFQANGSGITVGDITDLQFDGLTVGAVANNQDGVTISFTDFGTSTENVTLNSASTGGSPYTIPLTTLGNFSPAATGLFIQPDNTASSNRWNVSGLSVSYVVPEPSSTTLLGLGLTGLLFRRRRP